MDELKKMRLPAKELLTIGILGKKEQTCTCSGKLRIEEDF